MMSFFGGKREYLMQAVRTYARWGLTMNDARAGDVLAARKRGWTLANVPQTNLEARKVCFHPTLLTSQHVGE
jgi:hypothetical protein